MLISFALALVMSLLALAQEATKPGEMRQEPMKAEKTSEKAVSLSGKVSADGKNVRRQGQQELDLEQPRGPEGP